MLRALLERAVVILVTADQSAKAVVFVVILFPRRRGLLCELPRGIVGIFICDVIILLFCRPVKFVVGILNSLPVAIGSQRESSFFNPLSEKISKNFLSTKKAADFLRKQGL